MEREARLVGGRGFSHSVSRIVETRESVSKLPCGGGGDFSAISYLKAAAANRY